MSDCFVLYLLLICMKKKKSGAGKFTNNSCQLSHLAELGYDCAEIACCDFRS